MSKPGYVYILTNQKNGTLYIGVTSNLIKRIWEHKSDAVKGFSQAYGLHSLVYYECFDDIITAIEREKKLKKYKREYKINLIQTQNPAWNDVYDSL